MLFLVHGVVAFGALWLFNYIVGKYEEPLRRYRFENTNAYGVLEFSSYEEEEKYYNKVRLIAGVCAFLQMPLLLTTIFGMIMFFAAAIKFTN